MDLEDARRLHNQLWGLPAWVRHNPAPTPVSLGRADLPVLRRGYVVTAKTDGERCTLLVGAATQDPSRTFAVRFDRTGTATRLGLRRARRVRLDEDPKADPCEGTLLDCEWVPGRRTFVLLDAMAVCGYDVKPVQDLHRRLALGRAAAAAMDLHDAEGPVRVAGKAFLPLSALDAIDAHGGADGLVFVPAQAPIRTGRCTTMFKWKPHHTVDALWRGGALVFGDKGGFVAADTVGVVVDPDETSSLAVDTVYELMPLDDVEDGAVGTHAVVGPRPDKGAVPNQVDTVHAALLHGKEGITQGELARLFASSS